MDILKKYQGSNPAREFVKHRRSGFCGEILHAPHPGGAPLVSIIIPTRDAYGKGYFPKLIRQLEKQTLWDQTEMIVIKGEIRQGRAINAGADIALGKYILTLDDDEVLGPDDVLERLFEAMEDNSDIGMAGGSNVIPPDAPPLVQRAMQEIPRRTTPAVNEITDSDLAEHPLLMMQRDVFIRVGGENEIIPRGLDPYLRQEFRNAGFRVVVVPGVRYSHLLPDSVSKLVRQFFSNGKQAAYCNKFYPQWVIETPDYHSDTFREKMPLALRIPRYAWRMILAATRCKWVFLLTHTAYALGFVWGWARYKKED